MGIHLHHHGTDIYSARGRRINGCLSSRCQCSTYSTGTDEQLRRDGNSDTDITDDHTCMFGDKDVYVYLHGLLRRDKDLGLCLYDLGTCSDDASGWKQHSKLCGTGRNADTTGGK